jgi:heme A synthase
LAWITVGALFALMAIGNVVSATGSGLACPDWPLCHGRLVPPARPDVLVEYGHRLTAALTSVLLVTTVVLTMRQAGGGGARRLGWALLAMLAVQIALGGITVLFGLPHLVSTAHLVNALLILGGLVALAAGPGTPAVAAPRLRRMVLVGLVVLLVQLALGGYVRHSGAGLACPDFPLCSGDVVPAHWLGIMHWIHRWLGVALMGFFVHLSAMAWPTPLRAPTMLALALAVLQVVLGILTVLVRLDPAARAAHAAVGYALWAVLVWSALRVGVGRGAPDAVPAGTGGLMQAVRAS